MPETIWNNALADGDFNNDGNWTNQTPDVTHTPAIFDGTSQTSPTTNLNRGAAVFRLITTPDYTGDIGSSGSPLIWAGMTTGTTTANIRGTGSAWLSIGATTKDVVVESTNMVDACTITTPSGSLRYLVVLRGACTLQGTGSFVATAAQVFVTGNQSKLTIQPIDSTELGPDYIAVHGGTLVNQRTLEASNGRLIVSAGRVEQTGILDDSSMVFQTGGVIEYDPVADVSAKTPLLMIFDGVFDSRPCTYSMGTATGIKGPFATIYGDVQETLSPTLDLTQLYP